MGMKVEELTIREFVKTADSDVLARAEATAAHLRDNPNTGLFVRNMAVEMIDLISKELGRRRGVASA